MSANVSVLTQTPQLRTSKTASVTLWIMQILAALMFVSAGTMKLGGDPLMIAVFDQVGIGQWFRFFTGGLEVASALLLVIPRTSWIGGLLLAFTMAGAVLSHIFILGGSSLIPVGLLLITATIAWKRRPQIV